MFGQFRDNSIAIRMRSSKEQSFHCFSQEDNTICRIVVISWNLRCFHLKTRSNYSDYWLSNACALNGKKESFLSLLKPTIVVNLLTFANCSNNLLMLFSIQQILLQFLWHIFPEDNKLFNFISSKDFAEGEQVFDSLQVRKGSERWKIASRWMHGKPPDPV